jgi:tripartite-type tricarboxylate transporter receptor subunit TctC
LHPKVLFLIGCVAAVVGLAGCGPAGPEEFPSEQIEMIVPFPAGGGTDQTARQLASAAEETCGTNIIVSNQTGSLGEVGFRAGADAAPDGYTVTLATIGVSLISHVSDASITPEDFRRVMQFNSDPAAVSVRTDSDYETIDDFVAAIRSDDEVVRVATDGTGGIWHLAIEGLAQEVGGTITNVPFDGGAPAIAAVLGGQVEATSVSGAEVAPQVEAGELRALAVMGEERLPILPEVPTLRERGIDFELGAWRGLAVPTGTPDDVVRTLNECFREAYESEQFQDFMETQGFGMVYRDAGEFERYMDEEFERFGRLVESLGL